MNMKCLKMKQTFVTQTPDLDPDPYCNNCGSTIVLLYAEPVVPVSCTGHLKCAAQVRTYGTQKRGSHPSTVLSITVLHIVCGTWKELGSWYGAPPISLW